MRGNKHPYFEDLFIFIYNVEFTVVIDDSFAIVTLHHQRASLLKATEQQLGYSLIYSGLFSLFFQNETVQKLGARVEQLTVEAENSNFQRQKLSQEKTEAEQRYQEVCSQLQELRTR